MDKELCMGTMLIYKVFFQIISRTGLGLVGGVREMKGKLNVLVVGRKGGISCFHIPDVCKHLYIKKNGTPLVMHSLRCATNDYKYTFRVSFKLKQSDVSSHLCFIVQQMVTVSLH